MAQAYLRDNNVSVATDEVRIMPYTQNPNPQKCTFFFAEISIYFSTGLRTRYVNLEELPLKLYLRRLLAFVSKSFLNRNASGH